MRDLDEHQASTKLASSVGLAIVQSGQPMAMAYLRNESDPAWTYLRVLRELAHGRNQSDALTSSAEKMAW